MKVSVRVSVRGEVMDICTDKWCLKGLWEKVVLERPDLKPLELANDKRVRNAPFVCDRRNEQLKQR
jgi:hypothetical protein